MTKHFTEEDGSCVLGEHICLKDLVRKDIYEDQPKVDTQHSPEKQLIKDFIQYISDNHKCAIVEFPDEFAANSYVNYQFVNVCDILDEFLEERKK